MKHPTAPQAAKKGVGAIPIRFLIGVDCGVNTGLAVWDRETKKFFFIGSMMLHRAFRYVEEFQTHYYTHGIQVFVEDARQVRFGTIGVKAQGAGSVKRDAKAWQDFLTDAGLPFEMVRPNKRLTKFTQSQFRIQTKWNKPTNSHGRDAAMLVVGL